jgi:hypothetical protein
MVSPKVTGSTHHLIECLLQVSLLSHLVTLAQQSIGMLGQQFRRLGGRCTSRCITVDKVSASLVQSGHKAHFALEAALYGVLILSIHLEKSVDVYFGFLMTMLLGLVFVDNR